MTTARQFPPAKPQGSDKLSEHERRKREIDRDGARRALQAVKEGMRRGGYRVR